jgi:hypothetical protein
MIEKLLRCHGADKSRQTRVLRKAQAAQQDVGLLLMTKPHVHGTHDACINAQGRRGAPPRAPMEGTDWRRALAPSGALVCIRGTSGEQRAHDNARSLCPRVGHESSHFCLFYFIRPLSASCAPAGCPTTGTMQENALFFSGPRAMGKQCLPDVANDACQVVKES